MQHPDVPFSSVEYDISDTTFMSKSQSGKRLTRESGGGSRFAFTLQYPPLTPERAFKLRSFVTSLRGSTNTFTVSIPMFRTPQGTQTADTSVGADVAAGGESVGITGAGALATFSVGDPIQFSNHTKVYLITADAAADGAGVATLTFAPPLLLAVTSATETIKHNNIDFTVYLKGRLQKLKTGVNSFTSYELDVEEEI